MDMDEADARDRFMNSISSWSRAKSMLVAPGCHFVNLLVPSVLMVS